MARSPRVGDTYRAARRNGSGALPTHGIVPDEALKVRNVAAKPWRPKQERIILAMKAAEKRASLKGLVNYVPPAIASKRRAWGMGTVAITRTSSIIKLRRAINRGLVECVEPTHAQKMKHAWYRKQVAQAIRQGAN